MTPIEIEKGDKRESGGVFLAKVYLFTLKFANCILDVSTYMYSFGVF